MNYRKKILLPLSLIAGLCLALATAARGDNPPSDTTQASTPPATQDTGTQTGSDTGKNNKEQPNTMTLGEVSVVGIRASLAASLQTKRNADAVVDAVTATDIGKFPTTNVAEALALIPGVTLDHSMPATQRVSIDGLDPSLNLSLLDGHPVAQAMWLFGDSPNRGFNFSLLPAELVGKVEVYKSPEARLPEGSLGGTIIMHTADPLSLKSNTTAGSVGYNYNDLVSQGKPTASGFYSYKNDASTFGVDVSLQHYEEVVNRQGMENYGYTDMATVAAAATKAGNNYVQNQINSGALSATDVMPNELSAANFNQVERRNGVFTNIQFRPTDNFESTVSLMYMVDDLANTNQSTYAFATASPGGITSLSNVVDGIVTQGASTAAPGTVVKGDTAGSGGTDAITYSDNFARESEITTQGIDWRTKYSGYDWNVTTQAGVSDSTNPITQTLKEIAYEDSFSWNLGQGFTFTNPTTANDPTYWADHGWGGNHSLLPYAARDTYLQGDFTKDLDGVFNALRVGLRYSGHWESQAEYIYGGFQTKTLDQIGFGGLTDLKGMSDLGLSQSMISHVQTSGFQAIAGANPLSASPNYPGNPDANGYWNNTWNVVQEDTAGYVQGDFVQGPVHGNVGARVVQTKLTSQGFNVPAPCASADTFASCTPFPAGYGWETLGSTHTNVLPAANIAWDMAPDTVLRGAVSETIAFAPYNQLAPYFEANDTVLTAAAGNPNLSPYKSWNLDGSYEWYFSPDSALAGSVFYKDVRNYIVNAAATQVHINGSWTQPGYQAGPGKAFIATGQCTATGVCQYSVTQPVDGGTATVKGFAVSYQQAFADTGFGLRANYTYSDASTSSGAAMPYNSKNTYAISPYFEKYGFNASIAYSYRSSYLAGGYVAGAPSTYTDAFKELDAAAGYAINSYLTVNLNAINLLNSTYYQYNGSKTQLAQEYKTGRQYVLSLNAKF
ncbi:MAG TPA: TonB-dependent receptor [Gammaproteobacteria bacterium]|nr:TonB-dependent receptor [Gammaproteobacteria bacterium]